MIIGVTFLALHRVPRDVETAVVSAPDDNIYISASKPEVSTNGALWYRIALPDTFEGGNS